MQIVEAFKFTDILDPEEYLSLTPEERANIKEEFLLSSTLGKNDFGKIQVVYKTPVFKTKYV